jgi:hypothetical protein
MTDIEIHAQLCFVAQGRVDDNIEVRLGAV